MDAKRPSSAKHLERREFLRMAADMAAGAAIQPTARTAVGQHSFPAPDWLVVFKSHTASDRGVVIHRCSTDPPAYGLYAHFLSGRTLDKVTADLPDPIGVVSCDHDFADRLWHLGPAGTPIPSELNPALAYAFNLVSNPAYIAHLRKAEIEQAMKPRSV
ncbi:MAG: hypothetical protein HYT87_05525 [Nitrospirae bacterium]|nr:hypothetical protein [Nitrospirota bacterium]